jgi:uncharacterized membrane protein
MLLRTRQMLALVGLVDATYLTWEYLFPVGPVACLGGGGCDIIRASSYAYIGGMPLPLFGVLMYAVLAVLLWRQVDTPPLRHLPLVISGIGFLVSVYLTGVEALVIRAWCVWCAISAVSVTAIFVLSILEMALRSRRRARAGVVRVDI